MSGETIVLIAITTVIHIIGLGFLFFWMAAGYPLSMAKFKLWLRKQHFLPRWH